MNSKKDLLQFYKNDLLEALNTLEYSWNKLKDQTFPEVNNRDLEELEPWEAFTSRFARCTDIFISKYVRLLVNQLDPGFRGEVRDLLDKAEKAQFISNADEWMKIRELRNKIAHEYTKQDLVKTLKDVFHLTPFVLDELRKFKA